MSHGGQCGVEWDEWQVIRALVPANATVLELGARFGTTSCVLSEAVGRDGFVVAVEPDASVHASLMHNLHSHRCSNVHVLKGTVGSRPMRIAERAGFGGVGTRTAVASSSSDVGALPHVSVRRIKAHLGRSIDTLLLECAARASNPDEACPLSFKDQRVRGSCEGCIETLLSSDADVEPLMRHLKLILIEQDGRNVSYAKFWPQLQSRGFVRVWRSHAWYSPQIVHSAWLRGVAAGSNAACEAHRSRARLSKRELPCAADAAPD